MTVSRTVEVEIEGARESIFLQVGLTRPGIEADVQGLTTAAGIWLTAAIGVAAGMGREATAVLSTVLALVILATLPQFARPFQRRAP